jgi:hypothetical protein
MWVSFVKVMNSQIKALQLCGGMQGSQVNWLLLERMGTSSQVPYLCEEEAKTIDLFKHTQLPSKPKPPHP